MELQETQIGFDINSRVRELEGKYNLLRDRALIINQNLITQYKKTMIEINSLNDDIKEIKGDIFKLKETVRHLVSELSSAARKEDVRVLEKYISFWNPLKFMTEKDVQRLIQKEVENGRRN